MARVKTDDQKNAASPVKNGDAQSPAKKSRGRPAKNDVAKKDGVAKKTSKCLSFFWNIAIDWLNFGDFYVPFEISFTLVAKPKKAPAHPPTSEMVCGAIKALKNRRGVSMAAIYKYVAKEYSCQTDKRLRNLIHNFMTKEFAEGRLQMVNDDSETIKFNGRYKLIE